jgi:hypothetical protein
MNRNHYATGARTRAPLVLEGDSMHDPKYAPVSPLCELCHPAEERCTGDPNDAA